MRRYIIGQRESESDINLEQIINRINTLELETEQARSKERALETRIEELESQIERLKERQLDRHAPTSSTVIAVPVNHRSDTSYASVVDARPATREDQGIQSRESTSVLSARRSVSTRKVWKDRDGRPIAAGDNVAYLTPTVHGTEGGRVTRTDNNWVYTIDRNQVEVYKKGNNLRVTVFDYLA